MRYINLSLIFTFLILIVLYTAWYYKYRNCLYGRRKVCENKTCTVKGIEAKNCTATLNLVEGKEYNFEYLKDKNIANFGLCIINDNMISNCSGLSSGSTVTQGYCITENSGTSQIDIYSGKMDSFSAITANSINSYNSQFGTSSYFRANTMPGTNTIDFELTETLLPDGTIPTVTTKDGSLESNFVCTRENTSEYLGDSFFTKLVRINNNPGCPVGPSTNPITKSCGCNDPGLAAEKVNINNCFYYPTEGFYVCNPGGDGQQIDFPTLEGTQSLPGCSTGQTNYKNGFCKTNNVTYCLNPSTQKNNNLQSLYTQLVAGKNNKLTYKIPGVTGDSSIETINNNINEARNFSTTPSSCFCGGNTIDTGIDGQPKTDLPFVQPIPNIMDELDPIGSRFTTLCFAALPDKVSVQYKL